MTRIVLALVALVLAISTSAHAASCPQPSSLLPTTTPSPRPGDWAEQQAAVKRNLTTQAYQVITLGDSIMQGCSESRLSAAMGLTALNAGFGQDGTEHILWRLKTYDWHAQSPTDVLL